MATGSSQANTGSSQANTPLSEGDLATLHNALYPARNRYRSLGLQIGVKIDEIESIEGKYNDNGDRLLAILSVRLKQVEPLTWNDIDRALRLDCVGESKTADGIRKKYPHLFIPDPTIESTSDPEHEVHGHVKKEKTKKKKRRGKKLKANLPLLISGEQEEDSDEEVSGTAQRKKTKYLEQPQPDEDSSAISSEDEELTGKLVNVREKADKFSARPTEQRVHEKEKKRKVDFKEGKERSEPERETERNTEVKAKRKRKDKGKSLRDEFSEMPSDKHEYQSSDEPTIKKDETPKKHILPKLKPSNESSNVKKEMVSSPFHSREERQYAERKFKGKKREMLKSEKELRETHYSAARIAAAAASGEQEQYSPDREVSGKPTHIPKRKREVESESKDESSPISSSEEYTSEVASATANVKKFEPSVARTGQMTQTADDEREIENKKRKSSKKQSLLQEEQHLDKEGKRVTPEITSSIPPSKDKYLVKAKEKETNAGKEREKGVRKAAASGEREQYSPGRKVSGKPTQRKKDVESESDSESSTSSASEDEASKVTSHASAAANVKKSKPLVTHTGQKIQTTYVEREIEIKKRKQSSKKQSRQQHSAAKEGEKVTQKLTEKASSILLSKEDYLVKAKERETEKYAGKKREKEIRKVAAIDERKLYSPGREVGGKPTHKPKGKKDVESEAENESSSTSTSQEETSEPETVTPNVKKSKPPVAHTVPMIHTKGDEKETWTSKRKLQEEGHSKEKKTTQTLTEETKASIPLSKEKSLVESQARETEKHAEKKREKAELAGMKAAAVEDSTHEDSEDEESDLSEDEEDRDSEQVYSNEEEDTEPDDESFAATSEDEVRRKNEKSLKRTKIAEVQERQEGTARETGKGKEKGVRVTANAPVGSLGENESPGYRKDQEKKSKKRELSDPGKDQEEREIKPKKRSRRRHRESSMSPIAKGSSSPSTSQEERNQPRTKGLGKQKRQKKKKEHQSSSSEIDDSSPESDKVKNLPDDKKNKLSAIFTQFFGELCCAIVNPVGIAAQLQKKRLISKETMIEMLKSPESKQDKTIGLVSQLENKIDSYSDCLFVFIEVLLQNQALQSTGNEMLREAGKVCPERVAVKFPSQLPTTDAMGSSMGRMAEELSIENSSANKDGGRSSQEPSTFLGLTPVLTEYKQYLQSIYNATDLAPADKYLPTLDAPYINLAMIRRGQPYNTEQRDEFTRRTMHGGVDQILKSKTPINIEDLLTPEDSGRPVKFILVEGPPGIGKSTFAWEACRRWDEIESLRQYHTVVFLKLREKWVLNATQPSDLFRFPPKPELSTNIAEALNKSHGRNMLLVLDGFDEVSHSFHENSVIKSILCRQLLPECTIILTTRPSAKHTLKSICQPRVDKHVEIIGFTEEERVRYITEVFSKEPELQVNFLKYMFLVPHIKSMMYIPLNCAIIAQVYFESQSSRHVGIPRTRTQLYKALTHSLLVRHMKMKEQNYDYSSMLPEGLNEEDMKNFKTLTKFAFYSYHGLKVKQEDIQQILGQSSEEPSESELRKVTFFKEDIPEGLIHFGFMNESTEMYAGKGVEKTFSFLHLSLQEYLAAWHLANDYSIEFQVAYHRLAGESEFYGSATDVYKGDNREEKALISSLESLGKSLVEPAIFLAGITGMRCQSGDDKNHWEMNLSLDIHSGRMVLLRSLYEAQNQTMRQHLYNNRYFIGLSNQTPYDCYALSYCASDQDQFDLIVIINDDDVSLLETFVKGLEDHHKSTAPKIKFLTLVGNYVANVFNRCIYWLNKVNILTQLGTFCLESTVLKYAIHHNLLQSLVKFESLEISNSDLRSWEWLPSLKSLTELKALSITNFDSEEYMSPPPTEDLCWLLEHRLTEMALLDLHTSTDALVDSVLKSALKSKQITTLGLPNISRKTMAGVHSILRHCPSLTTLRLEDTRLGYDGILYICSALRFNTILRHLVIREDLQRPPWRILRRGFTYFSSTKIVPLPGNTTCTDFLLELNDILKDNTTLDEIKIQSGVFLPLSAGEDWEYCQWTGLGPLQQFNVGAVRSGMSPNLRRSFSSSDLTQPQTQLFWDRQLKLNEGLRRIDFKKLFSKRKEEGKKLFSLPSFTAPDTAVLQSFSGLDPRLKECLEISDLDKYVENLRKTYWGMLDEIRT